MHRGRRSRFRNRVTSRLVERQLYDIKFNYNNKVSYPISINCRERRINRTITTKRAKRKDIIITTGDGKYILGWAVRWRTGKRPSENVPIILLLFFFTIVHEKKQAERNKQYREKRNRIGT